MTDIRMITDEDILDGAFRKKVLSQITDVENINRKNEALRRHEVYRDRIKKWVIEALVKEKMRSETLQQMENRAANISICKKIVNKLARLYIGGVSRFVDDEASQQAISQLARLLDLDTKNKKADRYKELFRNTMSQIIPEEDSMESIGENKKFKLKARTYAPWQYDVIEDQHDHEIPRVVILSEFTERNAALRSVGEADGDGRTDRSITPIFHQGNRRDEIIADHPEDTNIDNRKFIWWNEKFHFTTDSVGGIIPEMSPEDLLNPIQMLPFANITQDQDGEFWAQGGDDLIDGSILINLILTDINAIAYIQGWGQPVIVGKGVKNKVLEGGPHTALVFEAEEGDPTPSFSYVSANPQLSEMMKMVEQYTALLLTTNNLSATNVAGNLSAREISGIALLIELSEAVGSTEDSEKIFRRVERTQWEIIKRWQNLLFDRGALIEKFMEVGKFENADVFIKFNDTKPMITEKEKLEVIRLRKELGINEEIDLIKIDNPDITDEEAEAKLLKIKEEKLKRVNDLMQNALNGEADGQVSDNEEEAETET